MKWAIGLILAVGLMTIGAAVALLDGPSAALFAFATIVVMVLGAAPVVFSALTRRPPPGPGPTVISKDSAALPPREGPPVPRPGRSRDHRRPRG